MYKAEIKTIIAEFANFKIPSDNFNGGRFQTSVKYFFAHVDHDGRLRKIEVDKLGGTRFFITI